MKSGNTEIRHIKGRTVRVAYFGADAHRPWIVDVLTVNGDWTVLLEYETFEGNLDHYFDEAGAVL